MPEPFARRWSRLVAERGPLCVGLAPSTKWLREWSLTDDLVGARRYCALVLDALGAEVGAYKVQVPFFERFGAEGLDLLRWFVGQAHERGALIVLDAKRGDADDTMESLAQLYLGPGSWLGGDAMTANAFMGIDSLAPLLSHAHQCGGAVLVMVRTSNHQAADAQLATRPDGLSVAQHLADAVARCNDRLAGPGQPGPVGAVVGARLPESADLLERLPAAVVEVPGLGRADRDTAEVLAPCARHRPDRLLLTLTTGLLRHGPGRATLLDAARRWRAEVEALAVA